MENGKKWPLMSIILVVLPMIIMLTGQGCNSGSFTVGQIQRDTPPNSVQLESQVFKPKGTYSAMAVESAMANPEARGALVRLLWEDIEPDPNAELNLDIDSGPLVGLVESLEIMEATGRDFGYSLGIVAGPHSPTWLKDLGAAYMDVPLQDSLNSIPKYWDPVVQERLKILAEKLARKLKNDSRLKLIYVPQMTSNGIEGHFNGISSLPRGMTPANSYLLTDAGYSEDVWVQASIQATKSFAMAFENKALAIEVHEILESANGARRIMYDLWNDPELRQRVGIGMWWISGTTNYQPDLIQIIKDFPGDKYGQIIGNSSQDCNPNISCVDNTGKSWNNYGRFGNAAQGQGFAGVFKQAKELKMRYIEPWNYEFSIGTKDEIFNDFNRYVDQTFK